MTAPYDWLQFGGDARHTSNNTLETTISTTTVAGLKQLFKVSLPATVQSSPVLLTGVTTLSGVRDLVFVTTQGGTMVALDANTGATIWSRTTSGTSPTVAAPAVDPGRAFVYGYGLDGKVHQYAVGDGTETLTGGWPQVTTLKPSVEKSGSALTIAASSLGTFLYAAHGGYIGDGGDYQGHITAINLATGLQNVFNMMCSDQNLHFTATTPDCAGGQKSGVWAKAGVVYDPDTDKIYAVSGNGTFAPASHFWGDTIVALSPDGTGVGGGPIDSYTPSNFQQLQNSDLDLGSTQPILLPGTTAFPHIAVQSGKDAKLRIINLDNMSGQGGPGHVAGEIYSTALPQGGAVQNAVATWINPADSSAWIFVVSPRSGIGALQMAVDGAGNPSLVPKWTINGGGGAALVANGVLFFAKGAGLFALNPITGAQLWKGNVGSSSFQSPIVANGTVYFCSNSSSLIAFR